MYRERPKPTQLPVGRLALEPAQAVLYCHSYIERPLPPTKECHLSSPNALSSAPSPLSLTPCWAFPQGCHAGSLALSSWNSSSHLGRNLSVTLSTPFSSLLLTSHHLPGWRMPPLKSPCPISPSLPFSYCSAFKTTHVDNNRTPVFSACPVPAHATLDWRFCFIVLTLKALSALLCGDSMWTRGEPWGRFLCPRDPVPQAFLCQSISNSSSTLCSVRPLNPFS